MDLLLRPGDAEYPARLLDLRDPPDRLFVRGALWPASPSVAIVGTRGPSEQGRELAWQLGAGLAEAGVTVVSGGALGIDGAAHRGALRAGRTVVVLPTALDDPAPRAHGALFRAVLEAGGAWVSEREGPPLKSGFRSRNRLIAALADVVVIVEAGARSGTLHTLRAARELGRLVAAVPWAPDDPRGVVPFQALSGGGIAVARAADVLRLLRLPVPRARRAPGDDRQAPIIDRVYAAIQRGTRSTEHVARALSVDVAEARAALTELELEGALRFEPGGWFALGRRSP